MTLTGYTPQRDEHAEVDPAKTELCVQPGDLQRTDWFVPVLALNEDQPFKALQAAWHCIIADANVDFLRFEDVNAVSRRDRDARYRPE